MTDDLFDTPGDARDVQAIQRDRWGRYLLPDPDRLNETPVPRRAYTRATTFNKAIADTYLLGLWQQRMVAKGLSLSPELYALAAATELEDRDGLNKICADAQTMAGSKRRAQIGTALHGFTELHDRGKTPTVPKALRGDFEAYGALVAKLPIVFESDHIERVVVVEGRYDVAGTLDRIGTVTAPWDIETPDGSTVRLVPGQRVIVDLKTGEDLIKFGQLEISVQLALYAHGRGMWVKGTDTYQPMPDRLRRDVALVIHLPVGRGRPEVRGVDIRMGWAFAELAYQVRTARKNKRLVGPVLNVTALDERVPVSEPGLVGEAGTRPVLDPISVERARADLTAEPATLRGQAPGGQAPGGRVPASEGTETKRVPALNRLVTTTSNGYPPGTRCIQCGRESKRNGNITHDRGCLGSLHDRRERAAADQVPARSARPLSDRVPGPELVERVDQVEVSEPDVATLVGPDPQGEQATFDLRHPDPVWVACSGRYGCDADVPEHSPSGECATCLGRTELERAIDRATTRAELSALWRQFHTEWTPAHTERGAHRLAWLGANIPF